jgi:hypothetical protein
MLLLGPFGPFIAPLYGQAMDIPPTKSPPQISLERACTSGVGRSRYPTPPR